MELVSGTLLIITDTLSTRPSLFLLVYSSVHFLKIWAIIFDANYARRPVKDKSGFVADHYMGECSTL